MKILTLMAALIILSPLYAQSDLESSKSVVKIITSHYEMKDGKRVKVVNTGTGWSWQDGTYVVTTLHTVAGISDIQVLNYKNVSTTATVIRVVKEADLALLKLAQPLGLKPLSLVNVSPNSARTYHVWGFPHGVHKMQGDPIRFSRSHEANPTLNSILTGNKLKLKLQGQGYPLPGVSILRISSTIQPGHSGAPILTPDGKVIGVADGGLRGGTARINWAMPAAKYVPLLATSRDPIPTSTSVQTNLYSVKTIVDVDATLEDELDVMAREEVSSTVATSKGTVIHKTWTASFSDIYETLDEDVMEDIDDMIEDGMEGYFNAMSFDIYEDYETGVSFAVPEGSKMTVDDGMFFTNQDNFSYAFIPFHMDTYEEAKSVVDQFVNGILAEYPNNYMHEEFGDDTREEDDDYEEYEYSVVRMVNYEGKKYFMAVEGEVDEEEGVLIMFFSNPVEEMEQAEFLKFLQFALSSEVYSFAP